MGRAVVATAQAAAGLSAVAGSDLLVGRTSQEFADAVISIVEDDGLRKRLGQQGRTFVERNHDWALTLRRFLDIVNNIAAG